MAYGKKMNPMNSPMGKAYGAAKKKVGGAMESITPMPISPNERKPKPATPKAPAGMKQAKPAMPKRPRGK